LKVLKPAGDIVVWAGIGVNLRIGGGTKAAGAGAGAGSGTGAGTGAEAGTGVELPPSNAVFRPKTA